MTILAMDTAGETASVALITDGKVRSECSFNHGQRVSAPILKAVDFLMNEANLSLELIDLVAADKGPGFFTSLKVGMTIAKTIAHKFNKPIIGVGSLDALTLSVQTSGNIPIIAALPARVNEVYAIIQTDDSPLSALKVCSVDELAENVRLLKAPIKLFIGEGIHRNCDALRSALALQPCDIVVPQSYPSASAVGVIAFQRFQQGETASPLSLVPEYVKPPSISISKRKYPQAPQ